MLKTDCGNNYGLYQYLEKLISLLLRYALWYIAALLLRWQASALLDQSRKSLLRYFLRAGGLKVDGTNNNILVVGVKSQIFAVLNAHYSVLDKLNTRADGKLHIEQITCHKW